MDAIKRNRWGGVLALVAAGALGAEGALAARLKKVPLPRPRPAIHDTGPITRNIPLPQKHPQARSATSAFAQANVALRGGLFAPRALFEPLARPASGPFAVSPTATTSPADIAAVKQAIEAARKGK